MIKPKRITAFLLSAAMTISLLPTFTLTAAASTTEKNITLGTAALSGHDSICYGTYDNNPIKWCILTMNGNGGTYADDGGNTVASSNAMFLLSKYALKEKAYESSDVNDNDGQTYPADWRFSDAWVWCNNTNDNTSFISSSFTNPEKAYLLKTSKANDYTKYTNELDGDTFFLLSINEYRNDYMVDYKVAKLSDDTGNAVEWWLRDANGSYDYSVGVVKEDGGLRSRNSFGPGIAFRPACNLNLSSILFTSASAGGKSTAVGTLSANSENTGSEYKLTMKDNTRSAFTAKTTAVSGNTVTVSYSNAKTGENEYISAIIVNAGGEVTHYGKLAQPVSTSGTATFDLTSINLASTDKLYIFNEQANGDYKTDFASELKEIEKDVTAETTITLTKDKVSAYLVGNKATLIVASYKDKTLKDVKPLSVTSNMYEKTLAEIGLDTTDADSVKAFLWADMETLTPLCKGQEVKLTSSAS